MELHSNLFNDLEEHGTKGVDTLPLDESIPKIFLIVYILFSIYSVYTQMEGINSKTTIMK